MLKIDSWLLDKVELVSHKIQRLTGYNCFFQAQVAFYISLALKISEITLVLNEGRISSAIQDFIFTALSIAFFYSYSSLTEAYTKPQKFKNPMRVVPLCIALRVAIIITTVVDIVMLIILPKKDALLWTMSDAVMIIIVYLLGCTPLPPSEGKIKKFFTSLSLGKILPQGAT